MLYRHIAELAVDAAEDNIGVVEETENWSPYIKQYLASVNILFPAPWCGAMCYFRIHKAAGSQDLEDFPVTGYVPLFVKWAKKHDRYKNVEDIKSGKYTPKKGDLLVFYFETLGRVAHIGFVKSFDSDKKTFISIEGNTSDGSGVDRDGEGTYQRNRTVANLGKYGGVICMD